MHTVTRTLALLLGIALGACSSTPATDVPAASQGAAQPADPNAALAAVFEQFYQDFLKLSPISATFVGDPRYNAGFDNPASYDYLDAQKELNERYLARVREFDPDKLDDASRLSWEMFVRDRTLALEGFRFPNELLPLDQMTSLANLFATLGSGSGAHPFRTVKDYDDFLARSKEFVQWTDDAAARMRDGVKRGVTNPQVVMPKVVAQLRNVVVDDPEKSLFWQPVKSMPESIGEPDRSRLTAAFRSAIAGEILPAYARLADYIEKEYIPNARTSVGWSALPDGAAWYALQVRTTTTTDMTPEEIHALGLSEVARIRGEMEQVMRTVGFKGDLHAFFKQLENDPQHYFKTGDEVVAGYTALKQRIDSLLPKLFDDFPKADYEVRAVEPFRAQGAAGAFYQRPSQDGTRPGIFYVNTHDLKAQPKYGMETLSLHEAAPGHHFQIAIQQELDDLPQFRRYAFNVAYVEGWALYAESLGKELGLFTDPFQWYGRLSDEMLRAMRLVVDTGLHTKGWTREQAIQYMLDNSSMAEFDVTTEVERYIVTPAQALGYKVGQLRISAIRAKAEAALGDRFDVKAFHSQVLRDGALPLSVLEAKIDRWVASRRSGSATAPAR
jgi:uncharacterized protein (DUF885 family)